MTERWVEHQAVFLESNGCHIKEGLYFYRSDQIENPFNREECKISRLGKFKFPNIDVFNRALLYGSQWVSDGREIIEPPPLPSVNNGEIVVWTRSCSGVPCVFGINLEEAKDVIFSLASTRASLVK